MKKFLFALLISLHLSSCSQSLIGSNISTQTIYFAESSGKIKMEINKSGQWDSIESIGSAALLADNNHAIEQAFNMATLRSKANLAEFVNNEIKSDKSTDTIISLLEDKESVSSEVVESIMSSSRTILKGIYVTERKISDDRKYVYVKIKTDRKTTDAINSFGK
jgi:IS30 family transposase